MKQTISIFILFFTMQIATGQVKTVKGTVTDSNGITLPGATVLLKNEKKGVTTDFDGKFSIEAEKGQTLIVSFLGLETVAITIDNVATINVQLKEAPATVLSGVVVTALGIKRERKELGYSFQDVKGKDLADNPTISVAQSLYGKVAGVNISQTTGGIGASSRIVIRGNRSISGDNQPLYVVDGVTLGNTGLASITDSKSARYAEGADNGDGLSSLNVDDIENISVLKGGAASALYGERGANGVIVITTKKGKRNSLKAEWNSTTTFDKISTNYKDFQRDYGTGSNGLLPNTNDIANGRNATTSAWGPKFGSAGNNTVRIFDGSYKPYQNVNNNIKDFFRTGVTAINSFSLSGGGDNTAFRLNYSNLDATDVIPKSALKRNTFTLGFNSQIDKLTLDAKFTYITENTDNRPSLSDDAGNLGLSVAAIAPNIDQSWLKNYEDENGTYYPWNADPNRLNPYFVLNENKNETQKNRILGNFSATYALNSWLNATGRAGIDRFTFESSDFVNAGTTWSQRQSGYLANSNTTFQEYNTEVLLNAQKSFGDFNINLGAGANQRNTQRVITGNVFTNMITNGINKQSNFLSGIPSSKINDEILVRSVYTYLRTNYKNYLFLDFTGRNDWNSTLASAVSSSGNNNYSYFYPSVSSSFIFTDGLNITSEVLTFGKIRASWAGTAKALEAPYSTALNYNIQAKPLLGNPIGSVVNNIVPNNALKPEFTTSYEAGIDLGFFKNRLQLDLSYYYTKTKNQLIVLNTSQTSGFVGANANAGTVENKGFEALVTAGIFRDPNGFNWDITLNFAKNENKLLELTDKTDLQVISNARWAGAQIVAKVGESSTQIYGKKFQRSPDGQILIDDKGNPILTQTLENLGKTAPDWIGGVINEFSYKGISLRANFDMKFGGKMYSMTNALAASTGLSDVTIEGREEFNAWVAQQIAAGKTPTEIGQLAPGAGLIVNGVTEIKDINGNVTGYQNNTTPVNPQTYWRNLYGDDTTPEPFIYDASYVKLREASISYDLPKKWLKGTGFDRFKFSVIGRNLWTVYSKVPNIDPESTYTNGNGQGFEYGSLPYRRSYGFNLQLSF
ncbi:SusC/RagA family TonB-linked outer membrane protein [Flavobacterium sp. Fl-318]|jgi:TonB-linked SusC/RagA family outer membrane protein|uniref:SusC/RagA family TonB-linked outer membrane protein n=1 Tax=Flavobacterium cupriresistens TaxID=2893885 RepID=A0ABU4RFU5_9FLAO|nr:MULTISPECIES: SusC/RagA family TonB-linked outer membrane protein [unclassified Flavobacterium]MDX6191468.1 SusC/RagA family TonB-linked outer membrane protein [Flavobacterium sp. Fl-318]UFH43232.1 SusC/RagA family TonB-linked outer membrane protein [Flavobacterium sp. F-323]